MWNGLLKECRLGAQRLTSGCVITAMWLNHLNFIGFIRKWGYKNRKTDFSLPHFFSFSFLLSCWNLLWETVKFSREGLACRHWVSIGIITLSLLHERRQRSYGLLPISAEDPRSLLSMMHSPGEELKRRRSKSEASEWPEGKVVGVMVKDVKLFVRLPSLFSFLTRVPEWIFHVWPMGTIITLSLKAAVNQQPFKL